MKEIQKLVAVAIIALVLILPTVALTTSSPPPFPPLSVGGNVIIDSNLAPVDTEISAEIDDEEVASTMVITEGKYSIGIPDSEVNKGKTIVFKVNGITDDNNQCECVDSKTTPTLNCDLAVTTESSTSSSDGGSSGGGGGSSSDTPENETIQGDINEDGKIDKYDFALMMASWGQTGSNNSDLNGDNKIDKYDFALLMLNWSGT